MKKLMLYLFVNQSLVLYNRRVRPRFFLFLILAIIIVTAFVILNWDSLIPDKLTTSVYWKGVF